MRRFYLDRNKDISGVSGCGKVANGIQFENSWCVIYWLGTHPSIEFHVSLEELLHIHGHSGTTKVVWIDD